MKIGLLCSPDMMPDSARKNPYDAEGTEQIGKLVPALDQHGIRLERVDWRHSVHRSSEFDAMLPLFAWDYWDSRDTFVETLFEIAKTCNVLNSPPIVEWNTDKIYLRKLEECGVEIVPTHFVETLTANQVDLANRLFDTESLVLKPRVGGGGFGQSVLHRNDAYDETLTRIGPALLQPFLKSVQREGEITTVWFGGELSHALRKVPRKGEYRVQSHFGGHVEPFVATEVHLEIARAALAALPENPLYARIDLLRGDDGRMKVAEAELIEPYFYLAMAPNECGGNRGAHLFAEKLADSLS